MGVRTRRKAVFALVVCGACCLSWRHGTRTSLTRHESFVPGLTSLETKSRPDTHEHAAADLDAVKTAGPAPSGAAAQVSNPMESELLWKCVSMFNAMMWGGSIVSSKAGIDALASAGFEEPGVLFGALRFTVATLCLSPWLFSSSSLQSTLGSCKVGAFYGAGYVAMFLALGLGTTAAKTSFFGSLQAVVCAGITCIVTGRLNMGTLAAAVIAVTGVAILEFAGGGSLELGIGDLVCSLVPLSFGAGWYVLGRTMKDHPQDTLPSTAIQLAMTALANVGWLTWQKGGLAAAELGMQLPQLLQAPGLLGPLCFSALVGNVLTMWLANEALRRVKGSDVALIAASEPLWAAVAAMALLGDVLQPHEILGGALLIGAVVCNETWAQEPVADGDGVDAPDADSDRAARSRTLSAPYLARLVAVQLRKGTKLVLPTARAASPSHPRDRH
ncbi:mco [Symbiodinium natans]|uniref:Mco protein n=1 Tax=Symbiodinium natans TaxID=878477 RepID=A0A812GM86_9DINO|nr:mco [Symbiodinium natans]